MGNDQEKSTVSSPTCTALLCGDTPELQLQSLLRKYGINHAGLATLLRISKGSMSEVFAGKKRISLRSIRIAVNLGADAEIMIKPFKCEAT